MLSIVNSPQSTPFNLDNCFDTSYVEQDESPIDLFLLNANSINVIFAGESELTPEKANLIVLGYMSAVESYFRTITRRLIITDEISRRYAGPQTISYAAAMYHNSNTMPEALLESRSFASEKHIKEVVKDLLGIQGGMPRYLIESLAEFNKICQLRHCIIHRFGKLGSNNAISLGILDFSNEVEMPIALNISQVESIAGVLRSFVKNTNNYLYNSVLKRTLNNTSDQRQLYSDEWTWDYRRDKSRFINYYKIFSSEQLSPPSNDVFGCYGRFRDQCRPR